MSWLYCGGECDDNVDVTTCLLGDCLLLLLLLLLMLNEACELTSGGLLVICFGGMIFDGESG